MVEKLFMKGLLVFVVNIDLMEDLQLINFLIQSFTDTTNMTIACYYDCIERILRLVSFGGKLVFDCSCYFNVSGIILIFYNS